MSITQHIKRAVVSTLDSVHPAIWMRASLILKNHNLEPELWLVPQLLSEGGIAIDVGANAGMYSTQFARYAAAVHAFEPNPICLRQLARVLPGRVTVHPCALSDHAGKATLRFDPQNTGIGTIEQSNELKGNEGIKQIVSAEVEIRMLDSFGFAGVGLIKIDAEGHEESVLQGSGQVLASSRPSVLVEIEERHNPGGLSRIRALFERMDYVAAAIDGGSLRRLELVEAEGRRALASADGINNFIFMDRAKAKRLFAIE
jgi:FkbM family methyltransferase